MDKGKIALFSFIVAISTSVVLYLTSYNIRKDIDSWMYLAQVASDPGDMVEYITKAKDGMERWNMTQGYTVIFFPTSENNMALIYRAVKSNLTLAQDVEKMDPLSDQYQSGLDNIRGSIRELNLQTTNHWKANEGIGLLFINWASWIIFGVLALIWLFTQ